MGLYHQDVPEKWVLTYNRKREDADQLMSALDTETGTYYENIEIEGTQRPINVLNRHLDYKEKVPTENEAEIRDLTTQGIKTLVNNILEENKPHSKT